MNDVQTMTLAVCQGPDDALAITALSDALQEAGVDSSAAIERSRELSLLAKACRAVKDPGRAGQRLRTRIRRECFCADNTSVPVLAVSGDQPPRKTGECAYHTFRQSGGVCNYPGSAIRAGYKVDYHASTLQITVGAGWIAREVFGER